MRGSSDTRTAFTGVATFSSSFCSFFSSHICEKESNGAVGLSVVSVPVERFPMHLACPQQAWNLVEPQGHALKFVPRGYAFYANSYCMRSVPIGWNAAISHHGDVPFIAALQSGSVLALQFHPELSGNYGSAVMASWLHTTSAIPPSTGQSVKTPYVNRSLCRVIPCLDVKVKTTLPHDDGFSPIFSSHL